jgi:hypothetical protein
MFTDLPWHCSEWDDNLKGCISQTIPPLLKGKSLKKEWAKIHKNKAIVCNLDPSQLAIYSDGSMFFKDGVHKTGLGVAAYHLRKMIFESSALLGEHVIVYDTEMEGILAAAELT